MTMKKKTTTSGLGRTSCPGTTASDISKTEEIAA
jgi:hypothetical protein